MSGATSVTGVGAGAAYGNKGPHNGRDVYVPLVSPHVVAAGTVTTAGGGTVTYTFPTAMEYAAARYAVIATPASGTTVTRISKTDSSSLFVPFTLTGAASTAHDFVVVLVGVH